MAQPATALTPSSLSALVWIYTLLAVIAVCIRTSIRFNVSRKLELDDFLVYCALLCLISMSILYMWAIPPMYQLENVLHGMVQPGLDFEQQSTLFLKCQFALVILFWTSLWLVKASFLAFYGLLFKQVQGTMIWCWWITIAVCSITYIGCWITQLLSCNPVSDYFVLGACESPRDILFSNTSMWYSTAADIFCDVLIMALPIRMLFNLKLDIRRKLALGCVFGAGIFIIIISILRIIFTRPGSEQVNPIWLAIWSPTETTVAIIVSCTPAFRVLLVRHESQQGKSTRKPGATRSNSGDSYEQRMIELDNIMDQVAIVGGGRPMSRQRSDDTMTALPPVKAKMPRSVSIETMLSKPLSSHDLPV